MWLTAKILPLATAVVASTAHLALSQDVVIDKMWSTTWDHSKVQELSNPAIAFTNGSALAASVNVTAAESSSSSTHHDQIGISIQENQVHQLVEAFGGGITDSVAITLQEFKKRHSQDYDDLLHLLFSTEPEWFAKGGVGMNAVRVPLGACDFGVSPYTYDDTEDGSEDPNLELFTIKKVPKLWATLKDIVAINPSLKIFATAWSAPGWMKENANADQPLFGGNLKAGMEQVYANYLVRAVSEIKSQEGLDVFALSPGNEPQIPELKYPTMKISAAQSIKLGKLLRSGLDAAGFKTTELLVWDHNWDNTAYPLQVLDADPTPWSGIAWHGYAGKPSAQKVVSDAYPTLGTYFTEHTQVTQYFSEPYKNMKNSARDLLIGSIRYMSKSVVMWNLVLRKDEDGFTTPHLPNVCENCNAAILLLPESTDKVATGDPNHTLTVAEAGGKRDAVKDATAAAPAPVDVAAGGKKDAAARMPAVAAADDRKNDTNKNELPSEPDDGSASRKRDLTRRADTVTLNLTTSDTTFGTGIVATRGDRASEAVLASKLVDAKETGNADVYESSLFKRTSDLSVLSHLSAAVRPQGASQTYSKRIGVTSTDELTDLGGRLLAQAFRQDGVKPGVTRFSVVLLNQNDHYETGVWEPATAVIAFRGQLANVTTLPGLYTLSWEAPTVATATDAQASDTASSAANGKADTTDAKKDS